MSDFLSHLADRALAAPPMVRPRLQSFYEPLAASALRTPLEEDVEVPAEASRAIEPGREHRLHTGEEEPGRNHAGEQIDRKSSMPVEQEASRPSPSGQPVLAKLGRPHSAPLPEQSEPAGTTRVAELQTPQPQMAAGHERHIERVTQARTRQTADLADGTKATSADRSLDIILDAPPPATQKQSAEPRIFSPDPKPRENKPASKPVVVAVHSVPQRREERAGPAWPLEAAPLGAPLPASAPSVHIAIGRVEIRAVLPPASEPRPVPQPSSARFSLDEYLKRNAGAAAR